MACTREEVFQALFSLLSSPLPTGFKVATRRYIRPSAVEAINTPILMTWEQPEKTEGGDIGLRKRWWEVWLIIVYFCNDQNVAGATILNPLIDAVEEAIRGPVFPVHQSRALGGLVYSASRRRATVDAISEEALDHG